ncbi:MAG: hypothetical protein KUG78_00495, partial [Kangiellaceae bacterium]|nr:hypothetical protein [Kangiellaceae bacterium]
MLYKIKTNSVLMLLGCYLLILVSTSSDASEKQAIDYKGLYKDIPIGMIENVKLSINLAFPK